MCSLPEFEEFPSERAEQYVREVVQDEKYKNIKINLTRASKKGDNYLGEIYRANISGKKDEENSDMSLILKVAPSYARGKMPIDIFYKREYYTYANIFNEFEKMENEYNLSHEEKFKHAKFHKGDLTYYKEFLIFEDLMVHGFKMGDRQTSLSFDHMSMLLKELSKLHALSFAMKKYDPETFDEMAKNLHQCVEFTDMFESYVDGSVEKAIEAMDDEVCKQKCKEFGEIAWKVFVDCSSGAATSPYNVLCHGDCWTNNLLFRYEVSTIIMQ